MSEVLPDFRLLQPATVEEAVIALGQNKFARLFAGGTDLLVNMRRGLVEADTLVDINIIAELKRLEFDDGGLTIGAGVSLRKIAENAEIARGYRAVAEASRSVAGPSHREAATIGGNLCLDTRCLYYNQSQWWRQANDFCLKYKGEICHVAPNKKQCRAAFSGDVAPALMVHGAQLEIAGAKGRRRIMLDEFYNEDGADHLKLDATEIVVAVILPPSNALSAYRKVRLRDAIDFPLAGVAIACEKQASSGHLFTLAITGTNSRPLVVDMPSPLDKNDNSAEYFKELAKRVKVAVTPLRTTTMPANYRRLSISAVAAKLAEELWAS